MHRIDYYNWYYTGDTQRLARATYTIEAPKHGLTPGDFVQIAGAANPQFPDGRYMVTKTGVDNFSIEPTNPDVNNFPLAGSNLNVPAGTWQKIPGEFIRRVDTPTGVAIVGQVLTLQLPAYAAGQYAAGGVVYVSNFGGFSNGGNQYDVPDGYYTIAVNQGAATIDITLPANNIVGAAPDADHPAIFPPNISIKKVGGAPVGGAGNGHNPRVMTTRGVPANTVRLFLPDTNYNIGDYFRMTGLRNGGAPLVIDGMTITQGADYQITNKDPNGNWIEFQPTVTGVPAGNQDSNYSGEHKYIVELWSFR